MTNVNPRRTYSSALRTEQAQATRRAVLNAARDLFLAQGYGATTIEQIAQRSGVSKPTVFSAVGNKQMLLATVRDRAIAGDDQPIPIARRPATDRIKDEPDQRRAIQLLVRHLTSVAQRYAPIYDMLHGAASNGEASLWALWRTENEERLIGARFWYKTLQAKGDRNQPGLDERKAVDALWLLMAPDHYARLVHDRGWTDKDYERWLAAQIARLFVAEQ